MTGPGPGSGDDVGMDEDLPVDAFLDGYPPVMRAIANELRGIVVAAVPDAVESMRPGWSWIRYSLPERRRVRTFAWIGVERKHVHLGFENGVLLADPDRVLHGRQERLKRFRYLTFVWNVDVDEDVLVRFTRAAAELALLPPAARRAMIEDAATLVEG